MLHSFRNIVYVTNYLYLKINKNLWVAEHRIFLLKNIPKKYTFWFHPINPLSTRPHQNVVWYNNSWLGFLKNSELCTKRKRKYTAKNEPSFVTGKCCDGSGIILGEIICKSSNWQHIQRLKITILGANWQLFRLERIAKCSYFILSTQNKVLLICNENKEIYVANLMIQ